MSAAARSETHSSASCESRDYITELDQLPQAPEMFLLAIKRMTLRSIESILYYIGSPQLEISTMQARKKPLPCV